jgi:hypothetical protein
MKTTILPLLTMLALLAGCGDQLPAASTASATMPAQPLAQGSQRGGGRAVALSVEAFGGDRASYSVTTVGGITTVSSKVFNISTVLPEGTQRVKFADGTLVLDIDGNGGKAYRVYQAAFDRKPDMGGYAFWLSTADAGVSMTAIAEEFIKSKEFKDLYGNEPSNADLLSRYYRNVLHRSPDPGGYAFWLNALNTNAASRAQILADFSESPENQAQVLADIQDGIWIPATPKLAARIVGDMTTMPVGRAFAVDLSGIALTNVSAKIGATSLASRMVEGQLLLLVPQVQPGAQTLEISAGGQAVQIPITVTSMAPPADPRAYIDGVLAARDAEMMREEALAGPLHAPLIKAFRAELAAQRQMLASSTDQEMLRQTAAYIAANTALPPTPTSSSSPGFMSGVRRDQSDDCVRSGALVVVAGALTYEIGAAATALAIAPPPVNAKAVALGSVGFVASIVTTYAAIENFAEQCFSVKALALEDVLQESFSRAGFMGRSALNVTASGSGMVFTHKKSRAYALKEKEELLPPGKQVRSAAFKLAALLSLAQEAVSVVGLDLRPYIDKLSAFRIQRTKPGTAGNYRLGAISNSAIEGTAAASGDRVSLQFRFKEGKMPKDPVAFSFELVRTQDGKQMGSFNATLHPEPPAVIDAIFDQENKTVAVTIPPVYERKYECVQGAGATCDASLFCKPDEDLGSTWRADMRYTLDAEKKTATLYFPDGTVIGSYAANGGAIAAEVQYEREVLQQNPSNTFYGGGGMKLNATYDAAQGTIVGSMLLTTTISWTIDATVQVCTATVSFSGKEKTRLSPVASASPVRALP